MESLLNRLADQLLNLDEASLTSLLEKYRQKVNNFEPTREWERAVLVLFMINGVKAKNLMFNEQMLKRNLTSQKAIHSKNKAKAKSHLKVIK